MVLDTCGFIYFVLVLLRFFLSLFLFLNCGGDYLDVSASNPDREDFVLVADACFAGATTLSASGIFNLFNAISSG